MALPRPTSEIRRDGDAVVWDEVSGSAPDLRMTMLHGRIEAAGAEVVLLHIIDDGSMPSVALPQLPDEYAMFDPRLVDPSFLRGTAMYVDLDRIDGYDEARAENSGLLETATLLAMDSPTLRWRLSWNFRGQ